MNEESKIWIEVSLNGPHSKAAQPLAPHSVSEIVEEGLACAEAGASIVHFHGFDDATAMQCYDADTYGRIIEGLRAHSEVIAYGTVPMIGGFGAPLLTAEERYRPTAELAASGLLEWFVFDAGSVNFASYQAVAESGPTGMYLNPVDYLREGLRLAKAHGLYPTCGVWEPGFMRTAAALAEAEDLSRPIIFKFDFSEHLTLGLPPKDYALDTYHRLLQETAPRSPWMLAAVGADIMHLIPQAMNLGGHIRVGLEDAKLGSEKTNLQLVETALSHVADSGRQAASPAEVRSALEAASPR